MKKNEFITQCNLKAGNLFQSIKGLSQPGRKEENVNSVVYRILKDYNVKVTMCPIDEYLTTHPDYPSLKAVCDFFNEMKIQNYPLRLDETNLFDLSRSFIAHTRDRGGSLLIIYSINKDYIIYADSLLKKKVLSTPEFLKKWDGVVILIDPDESSGDQDFEVKRKEEIINGALLPALILLFGMVAVYSITINKLFDKEVYLLSIISFLIANFTGLLFSLFLFGYELNLKTKFTDKLCHLTTNIDCKSVTRSRAGKIFGSITWADAGVAYFTGGLITLFLIPATFSVQILALYTLVGLPYPVFSILYQWLKIKKWCLICLSVQLVILLESAISLNLLNISKLNIVYISHSLIIYAIIALIVILLKSLFISGRENEHFKQELLKMKRDPDIFLFKLKKGDRIEIPYSPYALIFGENSSKILVSVFLSFNCGACEKRFNSVLKQINNNIKIQLIFPPTKDEILIKMMKSVFYNYNVGQKNKALAEIERWYNTDRKLRSRFQYDKTDYQSLVGFDEMIEYNSSLYHDLKISKVPSLYLNGYPLPGSISLEDIKYHIPELKLMGKEFVNIED